MLYLIGLGLNEKGISQQGLEAVKKCKKIYLENYTVDFPYPLKDLEKVIRKKIISYSREKVESLILVEEARKENIALLIYGSPLTATTHISLIQEAQKKGVKCEIIYASSILNAIAETGLQLYKFGKIASMPKWQKERNFVPDSFMRIVKENQKINAHSLILIDINLELQESLKQLEQSARKNRIKLERILVCSRLGTKEKKIIYDEIKNLRSMEIKMPYCIIIPSRLHFIEEEVLKTFS
ncbi:MAG: diphthine synthase [Candidatus Pacearchaeota archaeon]|nr:diphthine synthase [Candidatus Pacearchaeota archaeon]